MALITVCVPAYRSAGFIGATLASIQRQTLADYRVLIALEPDGAAETIAAAREVLADERFGYYVNDRTLGYAGNVRSVLRRVETPYFAVLPHDDLWHPRYLGALFQRLSTRSDASVAFADMYSFGGASGYRSVALTDGSVADRLLTFFLEGAEGHPWRGLTRTQCADRPFPDSPFDGFAVECEWTLQLMLRGPILRVAEPLYFKRQPEDGSDISVSVGWRLRMDDERLQNALTHHRRRLLEGVAQASLSPGDRRLIRLAAEAAMFRRWVLFSNGRFDMSVEEQDRLRAAMNECQADTTDAARAVLGRLHLTLARYLAQRGNDGAAMEQSTLAVEYAPEYLEAAMHHTQMCLRTGQTADAIVSLRRAAELLPMAIGLVQLEHACASRLAESTAG